MLRPRVLRSLPQAHQNYLFEEVRKLCRDYLRNRRVPPSEIMPEDLLSEVWAKFHGTTSLPDDDEEPFSNPSDWTTDPHNPERDGRVVWLLMEIQKMCGTQAMGHRCEDIRRRRFGRSMPDGGRRTVQPDKDDDFSEIGSDCDQEGTLLEADAQDAWRGLLLVFRQEHSPEDDAVSLLFVLEQDPDIFADASGMRWPVRSLVDLLDRSFAPPPWSDDRVENAKRRLTNWVERLMRKNGLDATDLEDLFARVARQQQRGKRLVRKGPRPAKLHS
jgi:hypothetical protein